MGTVLMLIWIYFYTIVLLFIRFRFFLVTFMVNMDMKFI